jgi:hypothetical protein
MGKPPRWLLPTALAGGGDGRGPLVSEWAVAEGVERLLKDLPGDRKAGPSAGG